jgi:hypothetical protein
MSPTMLPALRRALEAQGLLLLGGFDLEPGESRLADLRPRPAALLLVGNGGSAMWRAARLRRAQSLDAWTERTVGRIAAGFGLSALYPFSDARKDDGPWPFTRWAMRTGRLFASPLGLTIHPTYGLWHAFRAALLLPEPLNGALGPDGDGSPCERCAERPCLDACPVGAFGEAGYDFQACLDHLAGPPNACRARGCLARQACPVGQAWRYEPDHAAFHMEALIEAHGRADRDSAPGCTTAGAGFRWV